MNFFKTFSQYKKTRKQRQTVFILCSGVYLIGLFVYSAFASVELEPWAIIRDENELELPEEKSDNKIDTKVEKV